MIKEEIWVIHEFRLLVYSTTSGIPDLTLPSKTKMSHRFLPPKLASGSDARNIGIPEGTQNDSR
jgi:hypothetical protein